MRYLALVAMAALLLGCAQQPQLGAPGSTHEHADFKVYMNGAAYNFSQEKYMSALSPNGEDNCGNGTALAHLHDVDGDVVHKHATGVTWGYFFSTLNMSMDGACFTLDNGARYCNSGNAAWRYFLNGRETGSLAATEMHDLDRALFTYNASDEEIRQQLASVTSKASQEQSGQFC